MEKNTALRRLEINAEKKVYVFIIRDDGAGQDLNKE